MHNITIEKTQIRINGSEFNIDDLLDASFYNKYNDIVERYNNNTFIVNELYFYYIQRYLAVSDFVKKEKVTSIKIDETDLATEAMFRDVASKLKIKIGNKVCFYLRCYFYEILTCFIIIASAIYLAYLMIKIPYRKKKEINSEAFCVLSDVKREINGNTKIKIDNIDKEIEDIHYKNSIYSLFHLSNRFKMIAKSVIKSFSYMRQFRGMMKNYVGYNSQVYIDLFYGKRIVHTLLFQEILDRYLKTKIGKIYYTERNLERKAIIEEQLAKKYNIQVICIPHGIEYGFKFPKGFTGDIHYTTSKHAQNHLNKLYNTSKFVFDKYIAESMFKVEDVVSHVPKVIFFTEPREVHVNKTILDKLLPLMNKHNIELYFKLHPKDIKSDYVGYNLKFIDNINDAIVGNVCFARKSSILLEATYNDSDSAAILINKKDEAIFKTFASLQSDNIKVTRSIVELFDWIKTKYTNRIQLFNQVNTSDNKI